MTTLYSQHVSGVQVSAGDIVGSSYGVSGLNPIVDRINSISTADNLVVGSYISGISTNIITSYQNENIWIGSIISGIQTNIITKYQSSNTWIGNLISGTNINIITKYQNANLLTGSLISGTSTAIYPGSIVVKCFVLENRSSNPGDINQGRIWLEI